MEFGIHFFPSVGPAQKSGEQYFEECLALVDRCDELDYRHVRIVEHYFHRYGGYSPNPLIFLAAASQRSKKARVITGANLPVFNSPLKLASEIGMADAISGGRVEIGFGRAFLPLEYERFEVDLDESRARFDEGLEQIRLLLEQENVSCQGQFHSFANTTTLPRPTQNPRPPFWVAAVSSPESFAGAARLGHGVMGVPLFGPKMKEMMAIYRESWKEAGHAGAGKIMLMFHMFCWPDESEAHDIARGPINRYIAALVDAASDWTAGTQSDAYPGYDQLVANIAKDNFESTLARGAAWVGTPKTIIEQINEFRSTIGDIEIGSFQVNFSDLPVELAKKSMENFAKDVMPHFID
ncbi:MAG: LLM class flavin-dependent oxidoreductase [Rhodospirillales bacterium]